MVEIRKDGIYIDGEKFFLITGEFHYFRTLPGGWRRRLELMKDFGLTAVTTYVPWNLHQPSPDEFCFEDRLDIERFLTMAAELGLKVFLRPSPYMCGEFEFGGLPAWLLKDHDICLRSSDPSFMGPLEKYYSVLLPKIVPYLHTNGGPIILVGLENEYGSFGSDKEYLRLTEQMYRQYGIDVPLTTCGGTDAFKMINGYLDNTWYGADLFASVPAIPLNLDPLAQFQPDKPLMCSEAWVGHLQIWGNGFTGNREAEKHALFTKEMLEMGGIINYYMFCGGTNFEFTSGALTRKQAYEPLTTSYDYDAPITEEGLLRDKYFTMRDVLDEYRGKPKRPHVQPDYKVQALGEIVLTEKAPLLSQSKAIASGVHRRLRTVSMEDLGQDYGFIRYTTHIDYTDDRVRHLHVDGVSDRATVYVNDQYIGTILRDHPEPDITFTVPKGGCDLTILVENMGRVNYGYRMYDRKGILGCVRYDIENEDGSFLFNLAAEMDFTIENLPMKDLSKLQYGQQAAPVNTPCFYRGTFKAQAGVDTFMDMAGWHKGNVFINGFNIGRYWEIGPQRTLYVPGDLIQDENTIEVFEIHNPGEGCCLQSIDHALLCEIPKDPSEEDFLLL